MREHGRRAAATHPNILITWDDTGISTRKDIEWSIGIKDSCNNATGVAGPMLNITGLCGDQV
jgi:hypothetical protein